MFTGIVTAVGTIRTVSPLGATPEFGLRLSIDTRRRATCKASRPATASR